MNPLVNRQEVWQALKRYAPYYARVVPFVPGKDKLLLLDFTAANTQLSPALVGDTASFSKYINHRLQLAGALYGIGGYGENRVLYQRSNLFAQDVEPRSVHLGIDIWGNAGTPVFAPLGGMVHSFAFNNYFGDYGATIILQHQLNGFEFHTLYGHLPCRIFRVCKRAITLARGNSLPVLATIRKTATGRHTCICR
jgi:murein DD-endopeptidase MepM/ murein hydrolase activator NlpD